MYTYTIFITELYWHTSKTYSLNSGTLCLLFGIFKQRLQLFCLESKWCSYKIKTTNKDILIMYSSLEIGMSFSFLLRICYQGYAGLIKQVGSVFLFSSPFFLVSGQDWWHIFLKYFIEFTKDILWALSFLCRKVLNNEITFLYYKRNIGNFILVSFL